MQVRVQIKCHRNRREGWKHWARKKKKQTETISAVNCTWELLYPPPSRLKLFIGTHVSAVSLELSDWPKWSRGWPCRVLPWSNAQGSGVILGPDLWMIAQSKDQSDGARNCGLQVHSCAAVAVEHTTVSGAGGWRGIRDPSSTVDWLAKTSQRVGERQGLILVLEIRWQTSASRRQCAGLSQ